MGSGAANGDGELRAQHLGAVGAGPAARLGMVMSAFAVCAGIAATLLNAQNNALPITTALSWALVFCSCAAAPLVRRKHGERAAMRWILACAGLAPVLWSLAYSVLDFALDANSIPHPDGTKRVWMLLFSFTLLGVFVAPTIAASFAPGLRFGFARGVRRVAWGGLVVVALVCGLAIRRAASAPPSNELRISGTEVARFCPATQPCPTRLTSRPVEVVDPHRGPHIVDEIVVRGTRIERRCSAGACRVAMRLDDGRPLADHADLTFADEVGYFDDEVELVVLHNERFGYWIVDAPTIISYETQRRVFDANLRPTTLSVRDFARDYSAPRGWLYGAIAGVLFSGALLLWPARKYRGPLPEACTEGYHDGAGTLLVNGAPVGTLHEQGWGLAEGPVLWVRSEHSADAPYRATLPIDGVRAGTLAELRFAHAAPALARSLFALTALALTSAPIFAAALAGLVF